MKVVWLPSEYGDAVACIFADGILSLWEEFAEGTVIGFLALVEKCVFCWTLNNILSIPMVLGLA